MGNMMMMMTSSTTAVMMVVLDGLCLLVLLQLAWLLCAQ
jgi:hypothetical protein